MGMKKLRIEFGPITQDNIEVVSGSASSVHAVNPSYRGGIS